MDAFHRIAEERLRQALATGVLETTAFAWRPLPQDALEGVDPDLRPAWRLLSHAGFLPEELELRRESARLADLLAACEDPGERRDLERRLSRGELRYRMLRERRGGTARPPAAYTEAVRRRLAAGSRTEDSPGPRGSGG